MYSFSKFTTLLAVIKVIVLMGAESKLIFDEGKLLFLIYGAPHKVRAYSRQLISIEGKKFVLSFNENND